MKKDRIEIFDTVAMKEFMLGDIEQVKTKIQEDGVLSSPFDFFVWASLPTQYSSKIYDKYITVIGGDDDGLANVTIEDVQADREMILSVLEEGLYEPAGWELNDNLVKETVEKILDSLSVIQLKLVWK